MTRRASFGGARSEPSSSTADILLVEAQVDGGQLLEPHLVELARRPAPAGARLPPTVDVLRVRCLVKLDDPAFCVLELARAWVREQHKPGDAMPIPESLHAMTAVRLGALSPGLVDAMCVVAASAARRSRSPRGPWRR